MLHSGIRKYHSELDMGIKAHVSSKINPTGHNLLALALALKNLLP